MGGAETFSIWKPKKKMILYENGKNALHRQIWGTGTSGTGIVTMTTVFRRLD
jgi:hypothetical protein